MPTTPFGPYLIPLTQIFYTSRTSLSLAFVNLKPLLPGHILVIPRRIVGRYTDLSIPETTDLALTVRKVARMISRVYSADALNIAMQDGEAAGQSVPHVHFHIIPRRARDFEDRGGGDRIYEILEERGGEADVGEGLSVRDRQREREEEAKENGKANFVTDEERRPRSDEVMDREAEMLRREMEGEYDEEGGA
jgi:bis(5'-adenosyl)-triphosphatase